MNKPWDSKMHMEKLCASIGAMLNTERQIDPKGNRVYTVMYAGNIIGFMCMRHVYTWYCDQVKKLPISKRMEE